MRVILLLTASIIAVIHAQNNGTLPRPDLSGTDFSGRFCVTEGKKCPRGNIKILRVAILNHCKAKCLRSKDKLCQSVFWNPERRKCHLKSDRCALSELKNAPGVDLYRIKKNETCPDERPLYNFVKVEYSQTFCEKQGVYCKGAVNYKKAEILPTVDDCIKRCASHPKCAGVDYNVKNEKCWMRAHPCTHKDMKTAPKNINVIRLVQGESECPANRTERPLPRATSPRAPSSECPVDGDIVKIPLDGTTAEGPSGIEVINEHPYSCIGTEQDEEPPNYWWSAEFYSPATVHSFDLLLRRRATPGSTDKKPICSTLPEVTNYDRCWTYGANERRGNVTFVVELIETCHRDAKCWYDRVGKGVFVWINRCIKFDPVPVEEAENITTRALPRDIKEFLTCWGHHMSKDLEDIMKIVKKCQSNQSCWMEEVGAKGIMYAAFCIKFNTLTEVSRTTRTLTRPSLVPNVVSCWARCLGKSIPEIVILVARCKHDLDCWLHEVGSKALLCAGECLQDHLTTMVADTEDQTDTNVTASSNSLSEFVSCWAKCQDYTLPSHVEELVTQCGYNVECWILNAGFRAITCAPLCIPFEKFSDTAVVPGSSPRGLFSLISCMANCTNESEDKITLVLDNCRHYISCWVAMAGRPCVKKCIILDWVKETPSLLDPVELTVMVGDQVCVSTSHVFSPTATDKMVRFQCNKPLCGNRVSFVLTETRPLFLCHFQPWGQTKGCPANSTWDNQFCSCDTSYTYYKKECHLECSKRENVCQCNAGFVSYDGSCYHEPERGCLPFKVNKTLDFNGNETLLALDAGSAIQSSEGAAASLAVDDDPTTCSRTGPSRNEGSGSWWSVRLQQPALIHSVDIRLAGSLRSWTALQVFVDGRLCRFFMGSAPELARMNCTGGSVDLCGSVVVIQLDMRSQNLSICDLRVRGQVVDFYAKPTSCGPYQTGITPIPVDQTTAKQSDTYLNYGPQGAVDGVEVSCAIANPCRNQNPWWSVELSAQAIVYALRLYIAPVTITNRRQGLVNYLVLVDDEVCASMRRWAFNRMYHASHYADCRRRLCGKKITVIGDNHRLILCEIEVFGQLPA